MTGRIQSLALALALVVSPAALAQEGQENERGQLLEVSTFDVDPSQAAKFEATVKKLVEAAATAGTPYRWAFLQDGSQYTLVYPIENFAYFDDPMQFVRSFSGTEGEAMMQEAMASFETMDFRVVSQEIAEEKADWSYEVEGFDPSTMTATHFDVMWVKPGVEEKFEALNKEWADFFAEIDYPYPYTGHQVHFGDTGRAVYVTFIDDLAAYYGENSLEKIIAEKNMTARWQELNEALNAVISRWEHSNEIYRADMSYWPMETATN